jgi:IS5 family transposase
MKVHAGVDRDWGHIHSVVFNAANVHDLTPEAQLLQGDEQVVYDDALIAGKTTEFKVAMGPINPVSYKIHQKVGCRI